MRFSIIIATKDRAAYLERALESFAHQIGAPSFEVVIVDNGSSDATAQVIERWKSQRAIQVAGVFEAGANRGAARNRGIAAAHGHLLLFCDDDVYAPPGLVAAHDAAHRLSNDVVTGPILNVESYERRPKPTWQNYSRAFFCTCNVSVPKAAVEAVGGFDERFDLYGWEDTELGVRLRERGMRGRFAWDAYLWHIKQPQHATLESDLAKAVQKAHMAARFVQKNGGRRVRSATGAHRVNLLRAPVLEPLLPWYAGVAVDERVAPQLRALARAQLLDGIYTVELAKALGAGRAKLAG